MTEAGAVFIALQKLYDPHTNEKDRKQCDNLLQCFQQSPDAVYFCIRCLHEPISATLSATPLTQAMLVFSASTIYRIVSCKIHSPFNLQNQSSDVMLGKFAEICQQLWNLLTKSGALLDQYSVRNQISASVAILLLRCIHGYSCAATIEKKTLRVIGMIEELVQNQTYQRDDTDLNSVITTNCAILLTLKSFTEENSNNRLRLGKQKRAEYEFMIQEDSKYVIQHVLCPIIAQMNSIPENFHSVLVYSLSLKCLANWLEVGRIPAGLICEIDLVSWIFTQASTLSSVEDPFDVIQVCIQIAVKDTSFTLIEIIARHFVIFGDRILNRGIDDSTEATLSIFTNAAVSAGQSFLSLFIDFTLLTPSAYLVYDFLELMLGITMHTGLETATLTMEFWIDFEAYFHGKDEAYSTELDTFSSRLWSGLVERTEFPENFLTLSATAREQFVAFRSATRNFFRSSASVTRAREDKFISSVVLQIFDQFEIRDDTRHSSAWWRRTEVLVHALSAVSKCIREEDTSIIPRLFEYFAQEESMHPSLCRIIIIFLGVSASWFARNPTYLETHALNIWLKSFTIDESYDILAASASRPTDHIGLVALKKLVSRCGKYMLNPHWLNALLALFRSYYHPAIAKPQMKVDIVMIVESLAALLSNASYVEASLILDQIVAHVIDDMQSHQHLSDGMVPSVCSLYEHLGIFAASIPQKVGENGVHPVLNTLQCRWELLEGLLRTYDNSDHVNEKLYAMLIQIFQNLRSQASGFVCSMLPYLIDRFTHTRAGAILHVLKSALSSYPGDEASNELLKQILVRVVEDTTETNPERMDDTAELWIEFFDFVIAIGSSRPNILAKSQKLELLLHLVVPALESCQNLELARMILQFMLEVGSWYKEGLRIPTDQRNSSETDEKMMLCQQIQFVLIERGLLYQVLATLLLTAGACLPFKFLEIVTEAIRSCWLCFGSDHSNDLLTKLLMDERFLGSQVAPEMRATFLATISREECVQNPRKFRRVMVSFCDHFRKYQARKGTHLNRDFTFSTM
uniref:Uncharacterized protein AlNc14C12G1427 n=1 Tax=Albugo laibachii Nc14 TaxID=890382 RepID=F0W349_9STRA|nr:conserved hypothetical protein [Albugo laibachii Nc14]|eukprot:CCA15489.1 conserved hypothetical protein [Albugo laibachii Nc14]